MISFVFVCLQDKKVCIQFMNAYEAEGFMNAVLFLIKVCCQFLYQILHYENGQDPNL